MAYGSMDPRENIRKQIGWTRGDQSVVSVQDDWQDNIYIPLLFTHEVRTGDIPEMPFIEMTLVDYLSKKRNVQGTVRDIDYYIDFNLYFTDTDSSTGSTFAKDVINELEDIIMQNSTDASTVSWMEPTSVREIIETDSTGKQTIFHYVLSCYGKSYDKG